MRRLWRWRKGGAVIFAAVAALTSAIGTAAASPAHARGPQPPAQDPTTFDISQALKAMKDHQITSVQSTKDFLARISKYEPFYNAFTQMNPDALKEARASISVVPDTCRRGRSKVSRS